MKQTIQILAILLVFAACEQPKDKSGKVLDTPTTGEITIMVDEGYRPIVESSIDVFDSIYKQAKINALYVSEGEAVSALLRDSVDVIVITRQLAADEMKFFESRGFKPKITPVAYDALAFILHPDNPNLVFTKQQMNDLLTGKITKWNQLDPKSPLGEIRLVFDHPLSGTVRYVKDSVIAGAALTPNATALKTNEEVINYVAKKQKCTGRHQRQLDIRHRRRRSATIPEGHQTGRHRRGAGERGLRTLSGIPGQELVSVQTHRLHHQCAGAQRPRFGFRILPGSRWPAHRTQGRPAARQRCDTADSGDAVKLTHTLKPGFQPQIRPVCTLKAMQDTFFS